ncbi:MAG: GAF domain-containing protein [Chloroflexi bacterium]|nr:GAF domain-containing protein [Chloroflexota bacterium]
MDKKLVRALLVSDNEDDYASIRDLLTAINASTNLHTQFELEWADTSKAGLETIRLAQHHVYLVDYCLQEQSGPELLRAAIADGCIAPIILLIDQTNHTVGSAIMQAGAADYLDKSQLGAQVLGHSIRHAIERQQAKTESQIAEQEKASILDHISELVIYQDTDMKILWANKAACESVDLSLEQLVGRYCYTVWQQRRKPCTSCPVVKARKTGQPQKAEMIFPDGRTWFARGYPIKDTNGDVANIVKVTQDITSRKQMEKRLEHLNRLKENLLSPSSLKQKLGRITDGIVSILDADFARIWINKPGDRCNAGCIHADVTKGPHICHYRDQCLHLQVSSGRYTHIDGEMHQRVPFGCYKIGRVAAGEHPKFITNDVAHDPRVHDHEWAKRLGLASFAGYRLLSAKGQPIGVMALFSKQVISPDEDTLLQDLATTTAQVIQTSITAEALQESGARFRKIIENTQTGYFFINREGQFQHVNDAWLQMHKYTLPDEVIGQHFAITQIDANLEQAQKDVTKLLGGEPIPTGEFTRRCKDGSIGYHTFSVNPVVQDGQVIGLEGFIIDTTEQKQAEETLARYNRESALFNLLGRELTATLNLQLVMQQLLQGVTEIIGTKRASVWLWDKDQEGWLICRATSYRDEGRSPLGTRLPPKRGVAGWVAQTGESAVVANARDDDRFFIEIDQQTGLRTTSLLVVPLRVRDIVIGVLEVMNKLDGDFDANDLALVETLAAQAAIAIENARLFQAEQKQRELAQALVKAASAFNSILAPDRVLDRILEQVERIVAGDTFSIMLLSEDGTARIARWRGHEQMGLTAEQIARTEIPVANHAEMLPKDWEWVHSHISTPIQVTSHTVGFLSVTSTQPNQFSPADVQRLQAFANHAATAIENARLHRALQSYADQLERRVAERTVQLQAQYARSEAILRSINDGIIVTNVKGDILQTNPVAQDWLTHSLPPEDAEQLQKVVRDLAQCANDMPDLMLELAGLDLTLSAAPVLEEGAKEPSAAVVNIHDISHLKALDRMKTVLIANASDELRHPVTTIKSYAYLLQRMPPESKKWNQYLDALVQETDRQAQLVEDIMQISRIYTGRLEIEPQPTSLDELSQMVVARHQAMAQERNVIMKHQVKIDKHLISLVDPQQMTRVLSYLVSDAIRYTPEKSRVAVTVGQAEADGDIWATMAVSDMGEVIPAEDLPHIFERFFREEEPRSIRISESGIRLIIVKGVVDLHGGRVTVKSSVEENAGSTFTIWLPLAD